MMFTRNLLLGALMLAVGPLTVKADLLVTTYVSGTLRVQMYSDNGALESSTNNLAGNLAESLDCLTFGQDGTVYTIGNSLGKAASVQDSARAERIGLGRWRGN